jgi:hypothetical protein
MSLLPLVWFLAQSPTAAAVLDSLIHLPHDAVLYGIAFMAHLLHWHRAIPWVYLGLTIASLAFH